jgi:DNA-binding beta-propeller fold protein YncE
MTLRTAASFALAAVLLAGCASDPLVMELRTAPTSGSRLFPPPQTQEVPRYRFLGELTGEQNFKPKDGAPRDGARRFFAWLVGLGESTEQPTVLQRPQTGMVDRAGRVLVTDVSRNAVFVFDEAAGKLEVWDRAAAGTPFAGPIGIAQGPADEILVADAELGRVFRLGPDGKPRGEFGRGQLQRPTGVARDASRGRIFVADTHAHDIKVFDDAGTLLTTWGRRGEGPGELNYPIHIALSEGVLLVSDAMNARVQGFDHEGKPVLRVGQRGMYVGNLVRPKGVAADDEGNIYVVESMHDTLVIYDRKGQLLMSIGSTDQDGSGRFYLPAGVWVDSRNRVYVADMFNGRIAVFQFLGGN